MSDIQIPLASEIAKRQQQKWKDHLNMLRSAFSKKVSDPPTKGCVATVCRGEFADIELEIKAAGYILKDCGEGDYRCTEIWATSSGVQTNTMSDSYDVQIPLASEIAKRQQQKWKDHLSVLRSAFIKKVANPPAKGCAATVCCGEFADIELEIKAAGYILKDGGVGDYRYTEIWASLTSPDVVQTTTIGEFPNVN
jgi:hypothetical protein